MADTPFGVATAHGSGRSGPHITVSTETSTDATAHMEGAGPGWYFDPEDRAVYRYWDGRRWTERFSDTLTSLPTID